MKNEIMYYNATAFNESIRKANEFIAHAQPLLDRHFELGNLFPVNSIYDIESKLMRGAGSYRMAIIDALRVPEVAPGIKMKKEVYVETMEFPPLNFFDRLREAGVSGLLSSEGLVVLLTKRLYLTQLQ